MFCRIGIKKKKNGLYFYRGENMLYTQVINGILYMGFEGVINDQAILELSQEIDYMLYRQGINYYAIDFNNLNIESSKFINLFQK